MISKILGEDLAREFAFLDSDTPEDRNPERSLEPPIKKKRKIVSPQPRYGVIDDISSDWNKPNEPPHEKPKITAMKQAKIAKEEIKHIIKEKEAKSRIDTTPLEPNNPSNKWTSQRIKIGLPQDLLHAFPWLDSPREVMEGMEENESTEKGCNFFEKFLNG